jgi:furin
MQHIVVQTARPSHLEAADWIKNGVSRPVSHHFGYGLLDVAAMVDAARNWTRISEQHRCEITSRQAARGIPINGHLEVSIDSDGCRGNHYQRVVYLEHVQAIITLSASRRGEVEIFLTSPQGTRSTLLARRARDTSTEGFSGWAFMTTHSWSEIASGLWKLEIRNGDSISQLKGWSLVLYGTIGSHPGLIRKPIQRQVHPDRVQRSHSGIYGGAVMLQPCCLMLLVCLLLFAVCSSFPTLFATETWPYGTH